MSLVSSISISWSFALSSGAELGAVPSKVVECLFQEALLGRRQRRCFIGLRKRANGLIETVVHRELGPERTHLRMRRVVRGTQRLAACHAFQVADDRRRPFEHLGGFLDGAERVGVAAGRVVRHDLVDRRPCLREQLVDRRFHVRGLDLVEGNLESELDQRVRHRGSLAAGPGLRGSLPNGREPGRAAGAPPHRPTGRIDMAVPTRYILHQGPMLGALARAAFVAVKSASGQPNKAPAEVPGPIVSARIPRTARRSGARLHPARRRRPGLVPGPSPCPSVPPMGLPAAGARHRRAPVPDPACAQRRQPLADERATSAR